MVMISLRMKMQLAAIILFTVIFGTIFAVSITVGEQTEVIDIINEPRDATTMAVNEEAITTAPAEKALPQEQQKKTAEYIYYDVPLTDEFQRCIQGVCSEYEFDRYDIIIALIQKESSFCEDAISSTNDYGYMQINKCNHEWLSDELGIDDYLDGEQNITAGVYLLSNLYDKYGDIGLALMAYNCGEKGANDLWQQGIYSTSYSRSIIEIAANLSKK